MTDIQLEASVRDRIDAAVAALTNIGVQLGRLADAADRAIPKETEVPKPGELSIRVTAERHLQIGEANVDLLSFVVTVPAAEGDVVKRTVEVTLPDGSVQSSEAAGKDATEVGPFEVQQGSEVKVSAVNVDDAGNPSEPRVQSFTVNDTLAPTAPGELGIVVTGERTVE